MRLLAPALTMYKHFLTDEPDAPVECICRVSDGAMIPFDLPTLTTRSTLSGSLKATRLTLLSNATP